MALQKKVAFKEVKSSYAFDNYYELKYTVSGASDGAGGDWIGLYEINPFCGHQCLSKYTLPTVRNLPGDEVDQKVIVKCKRWL